MTERVDFDNSDIITILSALSEPGPITIAINSHGGELPAGLFLIDVFNRNADRIQLAGAGNLSSCAFMLWAGFTGYKMVYAGSWATVHKSTRFTEIRDENLSEGGQKLLLDGNNFKEIHDRYIIPELNKKEQLSFKLEADVLIPYTRLKRIAAKHNRINKAKKL